MAYDWTQLSLMHQDFRALGAAVEIGGSPIAGQSWKLDSIDCDMGVSMEAGSCDITLKNVYDRKSSRFTCENSVKLGTPVKVSIGYVTPKPVFKGYIHEVDYQYGAKEEPSATLRCLDIKGAMMGCGLLDYNGQDSYKDVINGFFTGKNARGYSVLCGAPDMGGLAELDNEVSFYQEQADDYLFLSHTAEHFSLECFVRDGKLLLRKEPPPTSALIKLNAENIQSLHTGFSCARYVKSVTVYGGSDDERDSDKKRAKGTATGSSPNITESGDAGRLIGKRAVEIFSADARDDKTALQLAKAQLKNRSGRPGIIDITLRGIPELTPGYFIDVAGVSPSINGRLYVTKTVHHMDGRSYTTRIQCKRS